MIFVLQFFALTVRMALVTGIFLVILYAVANAWSRSRSYHKLPRIIRNLVDNTIDFSGSFGPFMIIVFIIGNLIMMLFSMVL